MTRVARVVPDVTGIDKHFDYAIPDDVVVSIGDVVRVPLHGRSVRGWVIAVPDESAIPTERLLPLARIGLGPDDGLVALAEWAATRWCGPRRAFLQIASPERIVRGLPARRGRVVERRPEAVRALIRRGPLVADVDVAAEHLSFGPLLVVVPTLSRAARLVAALRARGATVSSWPREWDAAAGGVDVVVGTRSAVWARIPEIATILVIDEHDEAMQGERVPTWHAREVAIERAARTGARLVLTSPLPTVAAMVGTDRHEAPPTLMEASQWPDLRVVEIDARVGGNALVTRELLESLRVPDRRVALVHNAPGRSSLLACRTCRRLVVCEACEGGVVQEGDGTLRCRKCDATRPSVCQHCGGVRLGNLRPGVTRMREELTAATGIEIVELTATSGEPPPHARVFVGTEALLHRLEELDEVVIVDVDRDLYAPRFLAVERVAGLVVAAARIARMVTVQTRSPDHPFLAALAAGDIGGHLAAEVERRRAVGLPPFSAIALLTGDGRGEAQALADGRLGVVAVARDDELIVRATDHGTLAALLADVVARRGPTPRIEVDPTTL